MILVVDDETALLRVTEIILRKCGYDVLQAGDGVDAVAIYARQAQEIALVLTDVQMPRMDGIALSGALHHLNPHVPIIAATGHNKEYYENKLKAVGVEVLLSKPYEIWKLLKAIHGVLSEPRLLPAPPTGERFSSLGRGPRGRTFPKPSTRSSSRRGRSGNEGKFS